MDDYENPRVSRLRRHQQVDVAQLVGRAAQERRRLVPGLRDPSIPLNPVGNQHCPACGAHFPTPQEFCDAPDCDQVQQQRAKKA